MIENYCFFSLSLQPVESFRTICSCLSFYCFSIQKNGSQEWYTIWIRSYYRKIVWRPFVESTGKVPCTTVRVVCFSSSSTMQRSIPAKPNVHSVPIDRQIWAWLKVGPWVYGMWIELSTSLQLGYFAVIHAVGHCCFRDHDDGGLFPNNFSILLSAEA